MPLEIKIVFSVAITLLLPLLLWSIRPSQTKSVNPNWFCLGKNDPFFFGIFKRDGRPRKYTWAAISLIFLIFLVMTWTIL